MTENVITHAFPPSPCLPALHPHAHPATSCDNITIAPSLLSELEASTDPLPRMLSPDGEPSSVARVQGIDAATFEKMHGGRRGQCMGWPRGCRG